MQVRERRRFRVFFFFFHRALGIPAKFSLIWNFSRLWRTRAGSPTTRQAANSGSRPCGSPSRPPDAGARLLGGAAPTCGVWVVQGRSQAQEVVWGHGGCRCARLSDPAGAGQGGSGWGAGPSSGRQGQVPAASAAAASASAPVLNTCLEPSAKRTWMRLQKDLGDGGEGGEQRPYEELGPATIWSLLGLLQARLECTGTQKSCCGCWDAEYPP